MSTDEEKKTDELQQGNMRLGNSKGAGKGNGGGNREKQDTSNVRDSDFIRLDELVYAPLHALAESDRKLRHHIVESMKSMGSVKQNGQEEIIQLEHMNIAYEQVKQEGEDGYSVNNVQLQVPLLSIVPVTNLAVKRAKIEFTAEVRSAVEQDGNVKINGRICSPEPRESDFLPKVSYQMEIRSIPATEGVMRLTDLLSTNRTAKQIDATLVTAEGKAVTEEEKFRWKEITELRANIKKLKMLYRRISEVLEEQEKMYQLSKDVPIQDRYKFERKTYEKEQSVIMNRMMELQESMLQLELKNGLEQI